MAELKPDKGQPDGSCNRTACQAPLADEIEHQFMEGLCTGGPRLHYCTPCAREFDRWDRIDQPGQPPRITRELKARFAEEV